MSVGHKKVKVILFQLMILGSAMVANAKIPVLTPTLSSTVFSFKEWKNDKSAHVRALYSKLESDYISKKTANPKDTTLKTMYGDLKNMKSHLDEIEELTVSDYFIGYLSRFKDKKSAFNSAATKLDSTEVAELMTAYADSLLKTSGEGISTSSPGSATEASK